MKTETELSIINTAEEKVWREQKDKELSIRKKQLDKLKKSFPEGSPVMWLGRKVHLYSWRFSTWDRITAKITWFDTLDHLQTIDVTRLNTISSIDYKDTAQEIYDQEEKEK